MTTIRRAKPHEVIAIGDLLREHFDIEAGKYRDLWDDARLANQIEPGNLSPSSVAHVRKSLGMEIRKRAPKTNGADPQIERRIEAAIVRIGIDGLTRMEERIAAVEGRLTDLLKANHALDRALTRVERELRVSRGDDQ